MNLELLKLINKALNEIPNSKKQLETRKKIQQLNKHHENN
jgi:hypothetical protein